MNTYIPLQLYADLYPALEMSPLVITCTLAAFSQVITYQHIHFDNLLASTVVQEAQHDCYWEWEDEAKPLPVPLKVLWESNSGLPLYASSSMYPVGDVFNDVTYFHKRVPTGEWSRTNKSGKVQLSPVRGRYMERRIPFRTSIIHKLQARVIGNADEIARLLEKITHIGKKRSAGYGEVCEWEITEAKLRDVDCLVKNGKLARPIPAWCTESLKIDINAPMVMVGWSPPQWNPAGFEMGWPFGTKTAN